MDLPNGVAIIGAGLCGLSLALFLHRQKIPCTIYELRSPDVKSAGAIMLSPNALRSLNAIGMWSRIKDKGFHFQKVTMHNSQHEYLDAYEMGNVDKYGYDCLRIYRQVILDELRAAVEEVGVEVVYEKKFSHVVSESDEGVRFAFADGEERAVSLLFGTDGMHSSVRKYIAPHVEPEYQNVMAVICELPRAPVVFPYENYPLPISITGSRGAYVLAPQKPDGSDLLGGIQHQTSSRMSREDLEKLKNDKEKLYAIMRDGYETWNETVQSALDNVKKDTLAVWEFHTVPKIEKWASSSGNVIMLGDAAHAIPPAAGQGVNQAFESAHSLSLIMGAAKAGKVDWAKGLNWWHDYRQGRLDRVNIFTQQMNHRRIPGWQPKPGEEIDSVWLFQVDVEGDVKGWIDSQSK